MEAATRPPFRFQDQRKRLRRSMARVGIMIVIVIAIVTRDVVLIDRDASVIGAADSCTHGRRIAARIHDR
jgi:hypothetical protein